MLKSVGFLWMLLVLFSSTRLVAAELTDLYRATVAVGDQTNQSRIQAQQAALQQVLIKVSGKPDIRRHPAVKKALKHAARLLEGYAFSREQGELVYQGSFQPEAVDQLVKDAGFAVWDAKRPDVLIWLAVDNDSGEGKQIISDVSTSELKNQIVQAGRARGIRFIFPLMDMQDAQQVNVYDIWGGFSSRLQRASVRYNADLLLVASIKKRGYRPVAEAQAHVTEEPQSVDGDDGKPLNQHAPEVNELDAIELAQQALREQQQRDQRWQQFLQQSTQNQQRGEWQLQWSLLSGSKTTRAKYVTSNLSQGAELLVETVGDHLVAQYATETSNLQQAQQVPLIVFGLSDLSAMVSAQRLLQQVNLIERVSLTSVDAQQAVFTLTLRGSVDKLRQQLGLLDDIQQQQDVFGFPGKELHYQWCSANN